MLKHFKTLLGLIPGVLRLAIKLQIICRAADFPSCQTAKLPSYSTADIQYDKSKLPNYQAV
jgi:hypothetical protein